MNCNEAESFIQLFLDNELKGRKLSKFVKHMNECENCKEELTIQYLCMEGIARLEEGKTFDLDRELNEYIQNSLTKYKKRKYIKIGLLVFELVAIALILGVFLYALL